MDYTESIYLVGGWAIVAGIFFFALIGAVIPILPGAILAFAGVVVHRFWFGEDSVSWTLVGISGGLALFSQVVDLLASWWGAKRFGASRRGAMGALLGGLVGMFLGLPGILFGPFVGAVGFELMERRPGGEAAKAGLGVFLGGMIAFGIKAACVFAIIGGFFVALWS